VQIFDYFADPMSKMKNVRNQLSSLPGIVLLTLLVVLTISCSGRRRMAERHPLDRAADQFNATCPRMVDADTRIDSGFYIPESTFQFDYTLVNYEAAQIDEVALANYLKPRIRSNIRTNPEMKPQRDHQVTMVFHYRDRNGEFVTRVELAPEEY
jgi:hypothetical protein